MLDLSVDVTAFVDGQPLGRNQLIFQEDGFLLNLLHATPISVKYSQILRYGLGQHRDDKLDRLFVQYTDKLENKSEETCLLFCFEEEYDCMRVLETLVELVDVDVHPISTKPSKAANPEDFTCPKDCRTSQVSTLLLKTHVTCIQFCGDLLLAGIGDTLQVFKKGDSNHCWSLLASRQAFQGQHIHGICQISNHHLVVYGGKQISYLKLRTSTVPKIYQVYLFKAKDWVLDCSRLEDKQIALLTANNALLLYNLLIHKPVLVSTCHCAVRCIIYSGLILGNSWNDVVVLAGTVFSNIVVWRNSGESHVKDVIHSLHGHKGVIFSIAYCHKNQRICSTSDDRSVRVWDVEFEHPDDWDECTISLRFSLYGHSARVWKSSLLPNGQIVSIGEDSRICLWDSQGTLATQFNGHQDGEIWSLDVSEDMKLIATGGSDGGISLWPMKKPTLPLILDFSNPIDLKPKCVGLLKQGQPFMVSWNGDIFLYNSSSWNLCLSEPELKSYCVHAITTDRQMLAFASITGRVIICKLSGCDSLMKIMDMKVCEGRIFSLGWISNSSVVICGSAGQFSIWELIPECQTLRKEIDLILPPSKERWITSCATDGTYLVCGDRCGSLFLYRKDGTTKDPVYTSKRIHGQNGVTDVKFLRGNFVSTGRDGKYREFVVDQEKLVLLRCCKLKLDWAAAVIETNLLGRVLLCFHELFFVIWSINERQPVVKIDCGGGHRSWDCIVNNEQKRIFITFIKGKSVHYCCIPVDDVLCHSLLPGTHPKAINTADFINFPGVEVDDMVILGGEDTTLRLVSMKRDQAELRILQSHVSSVRAVACYQSEFNQTLYIASGGGRGQLVLWKVLSSQGSPDVVELNSHLVMSGKDNVSNDAAEMRIMDLQVYQCSKESVMIAACCSDGMLRIFDYHIDSNGVCEVQAIDCKQCLLNVRVIHSVLGSKLIVTTTVGILLVYSIENSGLISSDEPDHRFSVSQTGINSCDYIEDNGRFILSCAGDDALVNIILLTPNSSTNHLQITHKWLCDAAHTCQVSGLKMIDSLVITAALDQKLAVFSWSLDGNEIKADMIARINLSIPDIHGVLVWKYPLERSYKILVYGLGTQVLEYTP